MRRLLNWCRCLFLGHQWHYVSTFTGALNRPGYPRGGTDGRCDRCGKFITLQL